MFYDVETYLNSKNEHIINYAGIMNEQGIYNEVYNLQSLGQALICKENKGKIVIAHNGQGYDFQFLYQYLLEQGKTPRVVTNGSKIIIMQFQGITFIDSYSLIPLPDDRVLYHHRLKHSVRIGNKIRISAK